MKKEKNYQKLNKFLERYENKKQSFNKHKKAIELFLFIHTHINPETYFIDTRRLSRNNELNHIDIIEIDVEKYQRELEKNHSPNTVKSYISSIKQILEYYHCCPDNQFFKKLKELKNGKGNVFHDISPTPQQLKEILSNNDSLIKAFSLIMISTGIRPKFILDIDEKQDLHLEENPPRINILTPDTGNKKKRHFTYITEECKDAIEIWIKQKNLHIERTRKISNLSIKYEESTKLFPIAYSTISKRWNKLLELSGLNEQITNNNGKKQYLFHLYTLKEYFRSYLNNKDLAELLIGHTDMSNYYFNKQEEEIKKDYLEFSKNLYVFSRPTITKEIQNQQYDINEQITKLKYKHKGEIQFLINQNKTLQNKVNTLFELYHRKIHSYPDSPGNDYSTADFKITDKGERIDFDANPKTKKVEKISKSRQNLINEDKQIIQYWKIYIAFEKLYPELSEEELHHKTKMEITKQP